MPDSEVIANDAVHAGEFGLQHHFDTLSQQHEAGTLGMWTFLITEIMFFGGLFAGYIVYRTAEPQAFAIASHHNDIVLGATNTIVLIVSSLTMAMAVHSAATGKQGLLRWFILLTMFFGLVFLGIKSIEYYHHYEEGLLPGFHWLYHGEYAPQVQMFMCFYFFLTGMHALHMVIGEGLLLTLFLMARAGKFTPAHHPQVEIMGLYWHFVDIVWIFLFPLLYLIGRHAHP